MAHAARNDLPPPADRQRLAAMLRDYPDLREYVTSNAGDILRRRPAYLRFLTYIAKSRGY